MAIFRNVNMSFWTDTKVSDDFTPEDKYFMLYALTNQYTNIIGCYEVSIKQISSDLGYTKESTENLVKRFITLHKAIDYDFDTKELFVKNWNKYNWSESPKLDAPLFKAIEKVKSDRFHDELAKMYNERKTVEDTLYIPYRYPIDTTITIANSIPITNAISNNINNKEKTKKETFSSLVDKYTQNQELISSLNDYIEMRKKIKGFTIRALELALAKLDKLSSDDEEKIMIVNNAVMNGWKSFYPLKEEFKRKEIVPDWIDEEEEPQITSDDVKKRALALQLKLGTITQEQYDENIKELDKSINEEFNKLYEELKNGTL